MTEKEIVNAWFSMTDEQKMACGFIAKKYMSAMFDAAMGTAVRTSQAFEEQAINDGLVNILFKEEEVNG